MAGLHLVALLLLPILPPFIFAVLRKRNPPASKVPTPYPMLGSIFQIWKNQDRFLQWVSDILISTPNLTFTLHRPFGYCHIYTASAANVAHILRSGFHNYPKGDFLRNTLRDLLGDGIFNADGEIWKFQRHVSSHQFNTGSLRKFVEQVVDIELDGRLIPILENAARKHAVLDLQDVLQRFAFDNICKIAFGYDPAYLAPSLPDEEFARNFDQALRLTGKRLHSNFPIVWKIKRALGIGTEKQLRINVKEMRKFAIEIVREKKKGLLLSGGNPSEDLLSRFLSSGHSDENFVIDIVISFILAGRDTTSAALTWFFWLISKNPGVENEILQEIGRNHGNKEDSDRATYDEAKSMVYTHAALCEAMRLYPPVPVSPKSAAQDDVLPDGTVVRRGTRVSYHTYAMGRVEKVWGPDCADFRPERWLEREEAADGGVKWEFVGRDPFTYPVFQAGPRVCLGKEMAFLQMKRVVAGILRRFRVSPVMESPDPVYVVEGTSKMKGGFMVNIGERVDSSGVVEK